jgi:hypothetical protein
LTIILSGICSGASGIACATLPDIARAKAKAIIFFIRLLPDLLLRDSIMNRAALYGKEQCE